MPNLEALLTEKGTTFENAFVTNSLCCPSRATILRGQYAHNHQILSNEPPLGGLREVPLPGPRELDDGHLGQGAGLQDGLLRQVHERLQRDLHASGVGRVVRGGRQLPEPHAQRERPLVELRSRVATTSPTCSPTRPPTTSGARRAPTRPSSRPTGPSSCGSAPRPPTSRRPPPPATRPPTPTSRCRIRPPSTRRTSPTSRPGSATTRR